MNEKKVAQNVLLTIIFVVGIVELIFLLIQKTMRFHHLAFCVLGIVDTVISFVRHSEYKWCDFAFTIVYLFLLVMGVIIAT